MKPLIAKYQHGLSLVELIIALALMGMIVAISYPSLSIIVKSWSRIEFANTPSDDFAVERFVRQSIEQAMLVFSREKSTRENLLVFDGQNSSLSFVGPIDYFASAPGLYFTTFEIEEINSRQMLTFSYSLYREGVNSTAEQLERRAIIEDISSAELTYYSVAKKAWIREWQDEKSLPSLISFTFTDKQDNARQWIMPLKVAKSIYRYSKDSTNGS